MHRWNWRNYNWPARSNGGSRGELKANCRTRDMALDLQPVEEGKGLDLQPADEPTLDLQPADEPTPPAEPQFERVNPDVAAMMEANRPGVWLEDRMETMPDRTSWLSRSIIPETTPQESMLANARQFMLAQEVAPEELKEPDTEVRLPKALEESKTFNAAAAAFMGGAKAVKDTGEGVVRYITSPKGAAETLASKNPVVGPVIFAKWAYDMLKGAGASVEDAFDVIKGKVADAFNRKMISANGLGVPQPQTQQEQDALVARLTEDAVKAGLMAVGGTMTGAHAVKGGLELVQPGPVTRTATAAPTKPETFSEFGGETEADPENPKGFSPEDRLTAVNKQLAILEKRYGPREVFDPQKNRLVPNPNTIRPRAEDLLVELKQQLEEQIAKKLDLKPVTEGKQNENVGPDSQRGQPTSEANPTEGAGAGAAVEARTGEANPGAQLPQTQAQPLSTIELKYLREAATAKEPLPAETIDRYNATNDTPWAMPEGYALEGDQYVYTEPERTETPVQREAREQREAMAALRERKGEEPEVEEEEPPKEIRPTERVPVDPMLAGVEEEAPDILDVIGDHYPSGIRFDRADFGEYVKSARGRAKELMSHTRGEAADTALIGLHREGLYPRIETADDLADAMQKAGDERIARRERNRKAAAAPKEQTPPSQLASYLNYLGRERTRLRKAQEAAPDMMIAAQMQRVDQQIDTLQNIYDAPDELRDKWFKQFLQGKGPDSVERTLDRLIDAVKPGTEWTGRTSLGVAKVPVWLTQEAAALALRVAKLTYTTTRNLAQAVAAAVDHLRGLNLPGFNAGEAESWLTGTLGERATGQKILESPTIAEETKKAINEYIYTRRDKASAEQIANEIVLQQGLTAAQELWRQAPPEVPGDVRAKLIGAVAQEIRRKTVKAKHASDTDAINALAELEAAWWNEVLPANTELGQYISALDGITESSPEGYVAKVRQDLQRDANVVLDRNRSQITQITTALTEGRAEGLEELRHDPEVNAAARAAVDEAVASSAETKRAVVMEMAEPWASSPEVMRMARDQVQSKANELLNRAPRPPGFTPAQHLRVILDDLASRAAGIFSAHLQGAEPGVPIVDKFMQRLGVARDKAVSLAGALDKEWQRQLKLAQEKIPQRIAAARARQLAREAALETDPVVDQALRRQLRNANVSLGSVLQQEASARADTGRHVAERVVQTSGLTGPKAEALQKKLQERWDALVGAAQQRRLQALQNLAVAAAKRNGQGSVKLNSAMQRAFNKLVEIDRLAPAAGPRFAEVVRDALKLPNLTEADAAGLRELVEKAQAQPEGFLRQRAMVEVMKREAKIRGEIRWRDKVMGVFYANALSGFTTYIKIPFENLNLFAAHTVLNWLTRPGELVHPLEYAKALAGALKRGGAKGALQALETLRTGTITGLYEKPKPPSVMEMQPFGKRMEPLNFWKWFTRAISTAHEVTFKPAWELKQSMIARDLARRQGLRGKALNERVAELMGNTTESWQSAQAQAVQEMADLRNTSAADLARRTREIIVQRRESTMPGVTATARDYAQRIAYLNPSYGFLGALAALTSGAIESLRDRYPVLGTGARSQVPFVKVATNIVNEKLNWTPVGFWRLAKSLKSGELYGRTIMDAPNERAELLAKAITGTIALASLWSMRSHVHGAGPADPKQKRQLQAAGWIPHSFEWNGRYYTYDNTPLAMVMAFVGNVEDHDRYNKGDESDAVTRLAVGLKGVAADLLNQGYLDSVSRFMQAVGNPNVAEGGTQLEKILTRTAGALIFPNAVQQLDRMFDPTVYDQSTVQALLAAQVPFVRRLNKPVLNVLGEPVAASPFKRWTNPENADPVWRVLANKQAWIPEPNRNQVIGDKKRGPDYVRTMTADEYYDFIAESGPQIHRRLEDDLDKIVAMTPEQARAYVQRIAEQEHTKAKQNLF